jgi:hypothetical protein
MKFSAFVNTMEILAHTFPTVSTKICVVPPWCRIGWCYGRTRLAPLRYRGPRKAIWTIPCLPPKEKSRTHQWLDRRGPTKGRLVTSRGDR